MMKKFICSLSLIFILSLAFSVTAQSRTLNDSQIMAGYTEKGTYYEIYNVTTFLQRSGNSLLITRKVVYNSNTMPPREISWQEYNNNKTYVGTLYLINSEYDPKTNKTTATYQGVVTPQ